MKQGRWSIVSLPDSPDRSLKLIHDYLSTTCNPSRLRKLNWYSFLSFDHSNSSDIVTLACEAFMYLSITDQGHWNLDKDILTPILRFLKDYTERNVLERQLIELKELLMQKPVSKTSRTQVPTGEGMTNRTT
jgi:hypothetical protein